MFFIMKKYSLSIKQNKFYARNRKTFVEANYKTPYDT